MDELRDYVLKEGEVIANTILSTTENMANDYMNYDGANLHMDGNIEGYIPFGDRKNKMFFIEAAPDTNGFGLHFYIDETLGRVYHIHQNEKPFDDFFAYKGASYTSCLKDEQKMQIIEYIELLSDRIKTLKVDGMRIRENPHDEDEPSDMLDGENSEGFTKHN